MCLFDTLKKLFYFSANCATIRVKIHLRGLIMIEKRSDIAPEYKWDLTVIYKDEDAFLADYAAAEDMILRFPEHKDVMLVGGRELYSALRAWSELEERLNKLWTFAALNYYVDTNDAVAQSRNARVRDLAQKASEASWFLTPYLLKLDEGQLGRFFAECAELESFRRQITKAMRYKPHTLSDECEQLYSRIEDCLHLHSEVRSTFASADLRFGKIRDENGRLVELTDTNYIPYMMSGERRVRRAAFRTLYKTYRQFGNTFARIYGNYVKEAVTLARVRGHESSIAASTYRDEVTPVIYNRLIDTVGENLSVLFDYYELKREMLGVKKLHIYDIYAPLVLEECAEYTYDDARREVLRGAEALGKEYTDILSRGLYERRWVDVYPSRGKRGGAFSSGCASTEPYVMMNFYGSLEDVSTLAHECGHSMHSYYSRTSNEPHNSAYTLFVAEVASTVNELLFMRSRLRESKTDSEKLNILNQLMELYKSTLFRQSMLAEFERDMHAMCEDGIPLTAELINKHYYGLVVRYFGPDVVCDEDIACEWMRIPHFYMNFYVYKYATCISAASAIVKRIESEGESYVKKYIDFLRVGDSLSPLESLLVAEVDMTDPSIIESAVFAFGEAVAEFRKIKRGN